MTRTHRAILAGLAVAIVAIVVAHGTAFADGPRYCGSTYGHQCPPDTTEPPVTDPPVTEPPATDPPVTEPPVTEPPVVDPHVTEPPATDPSTTAPPITEPAPTDPPPTELPVDLPEADVAVDIPPVPSSSSPSVALPATGPDDPGTGALIALALVAAGVLLILAVRRREVTP